MLGAALPREQALIHEQVIPRLTLTAEIGCAECGGVNEFGTILDVAADDSGGVLVVTDAAPILRRFDRTGRATWSGGAHGNGPGEFVRPLRGMLAPGGLQVLDMTQRRVTRLDAAGRFVSSAPLRGFPSAVSARGRTGRFVVLFDDFRGGLTLDEWTPGDSGKTYATLPPAAEPRAPGTIVFPAVAIAPSGDVAFARDNNAYRIQVIGPDGSVRRVIARDLPRMQRTAEELAALERVRQRAAARVNAERG